MKMKTKKTKERKIISFLIAFTMLFTGLGTSNVIFADMKNAAAENEAVDYSVTSDLSEDKQTSKVELTMTAKENVEIQSIILPDGTNQVFNNEAVTYVSHKNEDIIFGVNYVNTQSEESKTERLTTSIKYTVSGIEAIETKADAEETEEKATAKEVVASNKLETIARTDTTAMTTLDISRGNITITATTVSGFAGDGTAVTAVNSEGYIITGVGGTNTIKVTGATTTIVLADMSIDIVSATNTINPMLIAGNADVTLLLKGTNSLQTSTERMTALQVDAGSSLTIDSANTKGSSDGSLSAKNMSKASPSFIGMGIGSAQRATAGAITILGGTIDALGGAGIGGQSASKITISGGDVTAQGAQNGAGIGGYTGHCGETIINGGKINATGGSGGAGIGNGGAGSGGSVTISGTADVTANGGMQGAGIGLGQSGKNIDITITDNPTIDVTGDRAAIGAGTDVMVGTIEISGGTIIANSSNTAIGDFSNGGPSECNTSITDVTISGIKGDYFLNGKNIALDNVKTLDLNGGMGGIRATGTLDIVNKTDLKLITGITAGDVMKVDKSTLKLTGAITASGGIVIDESTLIMGTDTAYASMTSSASGISISNSSIDMTTLTSSSAIQAKTDIAIEGSDITIVQNNTTTSNAAIDAKEDITIRESNITITNNSAANFTYGIRAGTIVDFVDSDVNITFNDKSVNGLVAYAPNINVNGGIIISNGYIYGNDVAGIISIQNGYIELTSKAEGIFSKGHINISGGYIDVDTKIRCSNDSGSVNIKKIAGEGDGNAIIFASAYSGNVVNLEQGIIFYNDGAVANKRYDGYVLGDVTLGNMIEENGTQFTIPKEYTLYLQESQNAALTVPLGTKLVNEGKILNSRTVTVDGIFENSNDAMVMNYNLTKDKGTATGGEFKGSGTLTNNGNVQNEVYVDPITLDGASYEVSDATLSTITGMKDIIGEPNSKLVYARQGDNTLYYNNILGRSLMSNWKYINTDLEYVTLTYDENYDGATIIPSTIVGKGKISAQKAPTRNMYTFDGWYREKTTRSFDVALGEKWNFETDEITEKTILYAKWLREEYSVSYNPNGGSMAPEDSSIITELTYESTIPTPSPMRKGFAFRGWTYSDVTVNNDESYSSIEKDDTIKHIELVAQWEINKYTINLEIAPGNNPDIVSLPKDIIVEYGSKVEVPQFTAPDNWRLAGWYLDKECTQKYDFNTLVEEDLILYGKWVYEEPTKPNNPMPDSEKDAPATGDSTNLNSMITLVIAFGCLSLLLIGKRRKRSDS